MLKIDAQETFEGDGVVVQRLFPIAGRRHFDPFVLWDHFDLAPGRGFPDHPHRGFEAVTYLFSGSMQHTDNLGNHSRVEAGGAQAFCAGRGLVHSEMPDEVNRSAGIQLWINLKRDLKTVAPRYQQALGSELPSTVFEGGRVTTIVGEDSPIQLHNAICYQHLQLDADASYSIALSAADRALIYVASGALTGHGQQLEQHQAWLVEQGGADLHIQASQASEVMLCVGKPHKEPIVQHGPFVD